LLTIGLFAASAFTGGRHGPAGTAASDRRGRAPRGVV